MGQARTRVVGRRHSQAASSIGAQQSAQANCRQSPDSDRARLEAAVCRPLNHRGACLALGAAAAESISLSTIGGSHRRGVWYFCVDGGSRVVAPSCHARVGRAFVSCHSVLLAPMRLRRPLPVVQPPLSVPTDPTVLAVPILPQPPPRFSIPVTTTSSNVSSLHASIFSMTWSMWCAAMPRVGHPVGT